MWRSMHAPSLVLLALAACGDPDQDGDGYTDSVDCAPADPAIHPGADEVCDGVDNNCDTFIDEAENAVDVTVFYLDRDADGFGVERVSEAACAAPGPGWATELGDCNDNDARVSPGAPEICNGIDDDCDGTEDEPEEASGTERWYVDADFDGFGDPETGQEICPQQVPRLWVRNGDDCDDAQETVYPGAPERCDTLDNDCDGTTDELDEVIDGFDAFLDSDGDGYGDPDTRVFVCELPAGHVDNAQDCRDTDPVVALGCACTDGSDGELRVAAGAVETLASGVHRFTDVVVESGGTLRFEGFEPVYLFAETVRIDGIVDLSGQESDAGPGGGSGGSEGICTTFRLEEHTS